jgi:hypothetical protein
MASLRSALLQEITLFLAFAEKSDPDCQQKRWQERLREK